MRYVRIAEISGEYEKMEKMYNLREASELLGISVRTLRLWITKGILIAKKYENGRNLIISEKEIERIKDRMK